MNVVSKPGGINDLKRQIIQEYIIFLKSELKMEESILADKNWARGNDDYYKQCRLDKAKEIENIKKQLVMLSKEKIPWIHIA